MSQDVTEGNQSHDIWSPLEISKGRRGRLIVFEGIDGAGTTTQARQVASHLASKDVPVHLTREPSDGPIGVLLRRFLMGEHTLADGSTSRETLALLFAADRADHMLREIVPRLVAGDVVISDRWYHSSYAYQGLRTATGWDFSWVATLNRYAWSPDLTIFLRASPEVADRRRREASRTLELFDDLDAQRQIARAYDAAIERCRNRRERVEIVDGDASLEEVTASVARLVYAILAERDVERDVEGCRSGSMNAATP